MTWLDVAVNSSFTAFGALAGYIITKRLGDKGTREAARSTHSERLAQDVSDIKAKVEPISALLSLATLVPDLRAKLETVERVLRDMPHGASQIALDMQKAVASLLEQRLSPQVIQSLAGDIAGSEYHLHSQEHSREKDAIGRYIAAKWGYLGTNILLDAGTTAERVARHIATANTKGMLVCTANLVAALHFLIRGRKGCYLIAGELEPSYAGFMSTPDQIRSLVAAAEDMTCANGTTTAFAAGRQAKSDGNSQRRFHRVAVVGALPLYPVAGPCSNDERTVHIKRTLLELADEIVFAVDFSKFHDDDTYDGEAYPVFPNPADWDRMMAGGTGKRVTIVTSMRAGDSEQAKRLLQLRRKLHGVVETAELT